MHNDFEQPHLEDLVLPDSQLTVELNSTSDNPVINVEDKDVHCGANFQAASVTAATEKVRLSLQSIGKMLFSQVSEMINHDLSNGLPPNLAADDPSVSFCLKGLDANTAAYTSELGFLANPVSNHVQSAEMHNQSINSLGLLSARQTFAAIECLSMIAANALYTACQGVDIWTLHRTFLDKLRKPAEELLASSLQIEDAKLVSRFWTRFEETWYKGAPLDADERADKVSDVLSAVIITSSEASSDISVTQLSKTRQTLRDLVLNTYVQHREAFFKKPSTPEYLGNGTKVLYRFVRKKLQVPLHRGLIEHPVAGAKDNNMIDGRPKKTIGSWVSIIYEAVRNGELYSEILEFLQDEDSSNRVHRNGNGEYTNGNGVHPNGNGVHINGNVINGNGNGIHT
ncbi:hypothetical protein COCCADRAFT_10166 [Bipolaris zeicola 26-R-13]|uniref:Phenylalanine ammonia-lyase n=1 Tax=Cochliobolus carbonum (strain 26-R-13) TaxID=930089 RepID=W6XJ96_COCC2|nr:uncharacterized protein COCCADRAFT_10166 [Bipolaris zeicola 26-R-13]EUC27167.1 hypothetical protein COCCADRAFT_10166 [Bipolaris zeicola 26-R-13]